MIHKKVAEEILERHENSGCWGLLEQGDALESIAAILEAQYGPVPPSDMTYWERQMMSKLNNLIALLREAYRAGLVCNNSGLPVESIDVPCGVCQHTKAILFKAMRMFDYDNELNGDGTGRITERTTNGESQKG